MQAADFVCLAFASDVSRDIEEGKLERDCVCQTFQSRCTSDEQKKKSRLMIIQIHLPFIFLVPSEK